MHFTSAKSSPLDYVVVKTQHCLAHMRYRKFELQKEDLKLYNYSNYSCGLHAGCLSYIKRHFEKKNYRFQWCYMRYID